MTPTPTLRRIFSASAPCTPMARLRRDRMSQARMRLLCTALAALLALLPAAATIPQDIVAASRADTLPDPTTEFRPEQLIVPGALIGVGTVGVWCFRGFREDVREAFQDVRGDRPECKFDNVVQYVPVGAYLGLGLVGAKGRHGILDRAIVGATAYLAMAGMVNGLKYTVRETRPGGARTSFPSGHSATAFTGAELMRIEYGWEWGLAGYAVACTTGFMRMYNDKHWYNDVLAGAGIGILSARIGYWMLPVWKRLFKLDRRKAVAAVMPQYDPAAGSFALGFTATF